MSSNHSTPLAPALALVVAAAATTACLTPVKSSRQWGRTVPKKEDSSAVVARDTATGTGSPSIATSEDKTSATTTTLEDCLLQLTISVASIAGLWGSHALWKQQQQKRLLPRHPAATMLSPTEAKVRALLQGDLSTIESSLEELHAKVSATMTPNDAPTKEGNRIVDMEPRHLCPEYEHFRAVMRAKRQQRKTWSLADDTDNDDNEADNLWEAKHKQESEYQSFRSAMYQKRLQQKQHALRRLLESKSSSCMDKDCGDESSSHQPTITTATMGSEHDSSAAYEFLFDNPKTQLGQVRDLMGTVLGKAPPSPSPFFAATSTTTTPRRRYHHARHCRGSHGSTRSSSSSSSSDDDDESNTSSSWGDVAVAAALEDQSVEIVFDNINRQRRVGR